MKKVPNSPWWATMRLHPLRPPADTDYADLGTAFGLDASLRHAAPETPPLVPGGDTGPSTDPLNRRSVI